MGEAILMAGWTVSWKNGERFRPNCHRFLENAHRFLATTAISSSATADSRTGTAVSSLATTILRAETADWLTAYCCGSGVEA